jgi:hypothetical protein
MPAPKSKSSASNGAAKIHSAKVTPDSTVPSSPAPSKTDLSGPTVTGSGKPDKAAYDAEQERIRTEIDSLQTKLVRALLDFLLGARLTTPRLGCRPGQNIFGKPVWYWK